MPPKRTRRRRPRPGPVDAPPVRKPEELDPSLPEVDGDTEASPESEAEVEIQGGPPPLEDENGPE